MPWKTVEGNGSPEKDRLEGDRSSPGNLSCDKVWGSDAAEERRERANQLCIQGELFFMLCWWYSYWDGMGHPDSFTSTRNRWYLTEQRATQQCVRKRGSHEHTSMGAPLGCGPGWLVLRDMEYHCFVLCHTGARRSGVLGGHVAVIGGGPLAREPAPAPR
jgi:hypothetical protein